MSFWFRPYTNCNLSKNYFYFKKSEDSRVSSINISKWGVSVTTLLKSHNGLVIYVFGWHLKGKYQRNSVNSKVCALPKGYIEHIIYYNYMLPFNVTFLMKYGHRDILRNKTIFIL